MEEESNREFTITRVFDASRELVFKAWTDEKLLSKWWGPKGFTNPVSELDARVGGKINIVMEDSAGLIQTGSRYPMEGEILEIIQPAKLVYISSAIMDGKPILENEVTVIFEDEGGKTKLTLHVIVTRATPEAEAPLAGMEMGWSQSLDKLADYLTSQV